MLTRLSLFATPRLARRVASGAVLFALILGIGGCELNPTGPSSTAPYSQVDLKVGSSDKDTAPGDVLVVNYTGWLFDATRDENKGLKFDSSIGFQPFSFTLGVNEVIDGWDRGLVGMKIGGIRRLTVPPSLGYGPSRQGIVPPNATMVFDVELLNVNPVSITTTSLPNGVVGTAYSAQLQGENIASWSVTSGSLPDGFSLSSSGTISGTPTAAGTFSFTIQAAGDTSSTAPTVSVTLSITITSS